MPKIFRILLAALFGGRVTHAVSKPNRPEDARASNDAGAESAFGYTSFQRYWIARLCVTLAIQMQAVAIGWQVYDLTRRPLDLGLVGLAQFLPSLGLALITGHVADRYDRRRVLSVCILVEAVCALLFLAFTLRGGSNTVLLFGVLVLFGTARAFEFPASVALLPNLVPTRLYTNAAAWSSSSWQLGTIVGPAIGGVLYVSGPATVYACCAVMYVLAVLLVISIRSKPRPDPADETGARTTTWQSLVAGISFIRGQPVVLGAVSLDLFAVLLGGATALLPVYARDILFVGPTGLGLLRSAPALGAVLTAVLVARRPIERHAGAILLCSVGVFGLSIIGFGLSRNLWVSLGMLFILGASDMVSVVIRRVLVLVKTPDAMRGRVSAIESVFIGASNELGEFESGVTAAWFGVVPAVVLGGLGTLTIVGLWARIFPQLRQVDRLD